MMTHSTTLTVNEARVTIWGKQVGKREFILTHKWWGCAQKEHIRISAKTIGRAFRAYKRHNVFSEKV